MNTRLLALYGLKWHPFSSELPIEALYIPPRVEHFLWRIEQAQIREGCSASRCVRTTAGVVSRRCVPPGSAIWRPPAGAPCCSWTRPRR